MKRPAVDQTIVNTHRPWALSLARGVALAVALTVISACANDGAATSSPVTTIGEYRSQQHDFRVVSLVKGLEYPWSLAFLPDGRWLISERSGQLRVVSDGVLNPQPIAGLPANIRVGGQGGLFDVLPHPDFAANRWLYIAYAGSGPGGVNTEVVRAKLDGQRLSQMETLFRALPKSQGGRHFGGRLLFGPDGMLYLTLGDRGTMPRAQNLDDHAGSVIRLHPDGRVPADNPFTERQGVEPEIFTYGNRNVQGIALRRSDQTIWMHEHGPRGGDEVNLLQRGANYGWPLVTYGIDYDGSIISRQERRSGVVDPVHYWDPSIAPSGLAVYEGERFPQWRGDLLVGALKYRLLVRLELKDGRVADEERLLEGEVGRIRDVRVGPDGLVYLLTDSPQGELLRLEPL